MTITTFNVNTLITAVVSALITALIYFLASEKDSTKNKLKLNNLKCLPGPMPLPIIGNLPSLSGTEYPCQAFDGLYKKYGPIVKVQLGSVPTVVCSGFDSIKEVLLTKTAHFDNRPNFFRYNVMFNGNKNHCKYLSRNSRLRST